MPCKSVSEAAGQSTLSEANIDTLVALNPDGTGAAWIIEGLDVPSPLRSVQVRLAASSSAILPCLGDIALVSLFPLRISSGDPNYAPSSDSLSSFGSKGGPVAANLLAFYSDGSLSICRMHYTPSVDNEISPPLASLRVELLGSIGGGDSNIFASLAHPYLPFVATISWSSQSSSYALALWSACSSKSMLVPPPNCRTQSLNRLWGLFLFIFLISFFFPLNLICCGVKTFGGHRSLDALDNSERRLRLR